LACFGNGVFFEFIERRSGYRGFGAANASLDWQRTVEYQN
jgi:4-hydroxyphenylpyruvate dioxygenase-like putative hemolysin